MKVLEKEVHIMEQCLTKPMILADTSCCLVEHPTCGYAVKMGFSYWCRHPEHARFHGHATGRMTREQLGHQYRSLRQQRQHAFVMSLDDEVRRQLFATSETDGSYDGITLPNSGEAVSAAGTYQQ